MRTRRKIIRIDEERCNGCGKCEVACEEGAVRIIDGKARIVNESYCDGLGACTGECPEGALSIIERDADAFDSEEVKDHLKKQTSEQSTSSLHNAKTDTLPCGCPSTHMQMFSSPDKESCESLHEGQGTSYLNHWPVQIRLIPSTAPFLNGAHLLVAADCTPVAYPDFHRDFLKEKVVMVGCPKFDDSKEYINKFAEIFNRARIKHVTILTMEVPCCSKLPLIIRQAMAIAKKDIPGEIIIISAKGKILRSQKLFIRTNLGDRPK